MSKHDESAVRIRLINAEARNIENPSFQIPPQDIRESLAVGDFAKIGIEGAGVGERFWVRVTKELEDGLYQSTLANNLITFSAEVGYRFIFGPEHVLGVYEKKEMPSE